MWYRSAQNEPNVETTAPEFLDVPQSGWRMPAEGDDQFNPSPELLAECNDSFDPDTPFTPNHQALIQHYFDMVQHVDRAQTPDELHALSPHFRYENKRPSAWAQNALAEGFEHDPRRGTRRITPHIGVGNQFFPDKNEHGLGEPGARSHVIHHEIGHLLEDKMGDAASSEFHKQGHHTRTRPDGSQASFAGGYWTGGSQPNETFAKGFSHLMENPQEMAQNFPEYTRFILEKARHYQMPLPENVQAIGDLSREDS